MAQSKWPGVNFVTSRVKIVNAVMAVSDMAEDYAWLRKRSQERRANNRESSPKLLEEAGFNFTNHNNGAHLVVEDKVDFWPGTGKWVIRGGKSGRGVRNLIKALT